MSHGTRWAQTVSKSTWLSLLFERIPDAEGALPALLLSEKQKLQLCVPVALLHTESLTYSSIVSADRQVKASQHCETENISRHPSR